jgi:hypothetical protein
MAPSGREHLREELHVEAVVGGTPPPHNGKRIGSWGNKWS